MTPADPVDGAPATGEYAGESRAQLVDAQTRGLAQEAGLDRDLESQVPPLYGLFTQRVIISLLVAAVVGLFWVFL